jgi:hypothetical protein
VSDLTNPRRATNRGSPGRADGAPPTGATPGRAVHPGRLQATGVRQGYCRGQGDTGLGDHVSHGFPPRGRHHRGPTRGSGRSALSTGAHYRRGRRRAAADPHCCPRLPCRCPAAPLTADPHVRQVGHDSPHHTRHGLHRIQMQLAAASGETPVSAAEPQQQREPGLIRRSWRAMTCPAGPSGGTVARFVSISVSGSAGRRMGPRLAEFLAAGVAQREQRPSPRSVCRADCSRTWRRRC